VSQDGELQGGVGDRHVAVSPGAEPLPRLRAQPPRQDDQAHVHAGRRRVGAAGRQASDADREDRSRPRDRAAARRLPRGIRAARRRRVRSQGSRRAARHRRGDVEIAGVQGAPQAARVADINASERDAAERLCRGGARRRRAPRGGTAPRDVRRVPRAHRRPARDPRDRGVAGSPRSAGARVAAARARDHARERTSRRDRRARRRSERRRAASTCARLRDVHVARRGGGGCPGRVHRPQAAAGLVDVARAGDADHRRDERAGGGRVSAIGRSGAARGGGPLREGDPRPRAGDELGEGRARSADVGDAAEEPRGDRSGDQREPGGGPGATGEPARAGQLDRQLQGEARAAAGHGGAHQRNAKRQRRRCGAHRLGADEKRVTTMRPAYLIVAALASCATASAQTPDPHAIVQRVMRDVMHAGAYQGRDRGPEQTDRFTGKYKISRDGRVSVSNISGDITVTGGSGDEVSVEATKRTRGGRGALGDVQIQVNNAPARVDIRTDYQRMGSSNVSVDYSITVPNGASVELHSVSGSVKVTGVHGSVRVETVSGGVTASDTPNVELAKTVSGDVSLSGISTDGNVTAGSVSGEIIAKGLKAKRLDLSSVSGDMTLTDVSVGSVHAKSVSGTFEYTGTIQKGGDYDVNVHSG